MNTDNINSDLVEKFSLSLSENERDNLKYKLSLLAKDELNKVDTINKYSLHLENMKLNTLLECLIKIQPYKNRIGDYGIAFKGRPKFITDELLNNLLNESEEFRKTATPNFDQYISQVETVDNSTICEKLASSQELFDFVSFHAGPVTPSFITSYLYYFKKDQESKVHVDNAFTSVTVMIGLKQVNELDNKIKLSSSFVYWPNKVPLYYQLQPGEVSIFFGASVLHGRTKLDEGEITNSLLISFRPKIT